MVGRVWDFWRGGRDIPCILYKLLKSTFRVIMSLTIKISQVTLVKQS